MGQSANTQPANGTNQTAEDRADGSLVDRIHKAFNRREYSDKIAEAIGVRVRVTDINGRIVRANEQWLRAHGFSAVHEVIGKTSHDVLDPVAASSVVAADLLVVDTGEQSTTIVTAGGALFQTTRIPLFDHDELLGVIAVSTPLDGKTGSDIQVVDQRDIDQLTGASSLSALHDHLEQLLRAQDPMSLLLLDLDDFHVVNNSLGREVGDRLLQKAAKRLITVFGSRLFRVGGDKFVIMLPSTEVSQLDVVTEQILQRWRQPLLVDGTEIYGGVSIGIAPLGEQAGSEEVLQDAEMALRKAKDGGRNRAVIFDRAQRKVADEELWQQMLVRRAVKTKEFSLFWQPIFEIETGMVSGAEALLRWQPAGGATTHPAAEFIPFLEHSGLVIPVGQQVIDDACRQYTRWRSSDLIARAIPIHVNVSRRQFTSNSLVADTLVTLQKHAVDPSHLILEVSDFSPDENSPKFLDDLKRLSAAGVKIAVDEFGAGWSALADLPNLPIQTTKVARSITDRIVEGQRDPILDSIQAITQSMNHATVVQGVENEMQLQWLRACGWTHAQGYHLSKPMSPEDMTAFLADASNPSRERWGNR